MKFKIIICIALAGITYNTISQWSLVNSGTNASLLSVCFVDQNTGWATGWSLQAYGKVVSTTNGGLNWTTTSISIVYPYSIFFIDNNTGWVCGNNGSNIIKTTDGGINWQDISIPGFNGYFYSIYFANDQTGWVVGSGLTIYKSVSGGEVWYKELGTPNDPGVLYSVMFIDDNSGWCVGKGNYNSYDIILTTSNRGITWVSMHSSTLNQLNSVYFINHNTGWCVGFGGKVLKTTNAGFDWDTQSLGNYGLTSVFFADSANGWITSKTTSSKIFRTYNGGLNWYEQYSGGFDLYSMSFFNANTAWAVGYNGNILKTTNGGGGIISVSTTSTDVPLNFNLSPNYPNPFNPVTKIKFDIAGSKKTQTNISVYDLIGNKVATLVNEELTPGSFEVDFDGTSLSSGVYFYKLTAFNKSEYYAKTMKMVLIK